jgi:hypothetical protein
MKNPTALDWLIQEIQKRLHVDIKHTTVGVDLFEEAKEMEKQQVMQAFYNGTLCDEGFGSDYAEEYYNQQYESEE